MTTANRMNDETLVYHRTAPRTLRSDLDSLRAQVAEMVAAQPIAATAAAAGVGFVLGARMARPAIELLMGAAARSAAAWLGQTIRETALAHLHPENGPAADAATDPHTGGN